MAKKKTTLQDLRVKEEVRQLRLGVRREIRAEKKKMYFSVDLETRRKFIALMHEGNSMGEAMEKTGIPSIDVALAIYTKNVKTIKIQRLNEPEDVK